MFWTSIFIFALIFSGIGTWFSKSLAQKYGVLDTPNGRSSHVTVTPRGGGIVFVLCTCLFASAAMLFVPGSSLIMSAVALCGGLVAGVGAWDDWMPLSARIRFLVHMVAALGIVELLGPVEYVPVPWGLLDLWVFAVPFTVLLIIWLINLSNFMDGIDGLAACNGLCFCFTSFCLYIASGDVQNVWIACVLAGGVLGFLIWNFPKAKIFMGDSGSAFLGVMVAILMLSSDPASPALQAAHMIVLAPFVVDATLTLLRRAVRGEKIFTAHRSHIYQRLSRYLNSHIPVTIGFVLLEVLILIPLALWVGGVWGFVDVSGVVLWLVYGATILMWTYFSRHLPQ